MRKGDIGTDEILAFWLIQKHEKYSDKKKGSNMTVFLLSGIFMQFTRVLLAFLTICFQIIALVLGLLLRLVFPTVTPTKKKKK